MLRGQYKIGITHLKRLGQGEFVVILRNERVCLAEQSDERLLREIVLVFDAFEVRQFSRGQVADHVRLKCEGL